MKIGKIQVLCICGGVLCFLLAEWVSGMEDIGKSGFLPRGSYGEGETEYQLVVEGLKEEQLPITVILGERQYEEEEAEMVFENIMSTIDEKILGDNPGLTEVRSDLDLITRLPEEGVKLRWSSGNSDIIDSSGHIKETEIPKEGLCVWLKVYMTTGVYNEEYEIAITVYPAVRSEEEEIAAGLQKTIEAQDRAHQTEQGLRLPEEYDGKTLHYREQTDSHNEILLVLGIVMAVLCYVRSQMQGETQRKKREQELLMDYAEIVFKLMVFISAGMTVLHAWERMVLDYEIRLEKGRIKPRAAYEEMYDTLQQITCGVPEGQALAGFGKRCQLQPYLKLSSLLEQNRKTGTKNLKSLLEAEMTNAWEQRKTMAKRMGEEAGTKLLFPLFLMLGIVMVIIMVPAMMSMM